MKIESTITHELDTLTINDEFFNVSLEQAGDEYWFEAESERRTIYAVSYEELKKKIITAQTETDETIDEATFIEIFLMQNYQPEIIVSDIRLTEQGNIFKGKDNKITLPKKAVIDNKFIDCTTRNLHRKRGFPCVLNFVVKKDNDRLNKLVIDKYSQIVKHMNRILGQIEAHEKDIRSRFDSITLHGKSGADITNTR